MGDGFERGEISEDDRALAGVPISKNTRQAVGSTVVTELGLEQTDPVIIAGMHAHEELHQKLGIPRITGDWDQDYSAAEAQAFVFEAHCRGVYARTYGYQ